MSLPSSIFFLNADINDTTKSTLVSQLYINEVMSDTEFDARVQVDPNYPSIVHLNGLRILVLRQSFMDYTNRQLADVVMFYKNGLVSVEKSNFGPPCTTYPIARVNAYELLRANNSGQVIILPHTQNNHCHCNTCNCGPCYYKKLYGIVADQGMDTSGIHLPNCDRESNNKDFINRK